MAKTTSEMLEDHNCGDCKLVGRCSMEPIIKYYKEHLDEFTKDNVKLDTLFKSKWVTQMTRMAYNASLLSGDTGDSVDIIITLSFLAGSIVGHGGSLGIKVPVKAKEENIQDGIGVIILGNDDESAEIRKFLESLAKQAQDNMSA